MDGLKQKALQDFFGGRDLEQACDAAVELIREYELRFSQLRIIFSPRSDPPRTEVELARVRELLAWPQVEAENPVVLARELESTRGRPDLSE